MREVLQAIARDEAAHARFCWHLAERLLPRQSELERGQLGLQVGSLLAHSRRSVSTAGMSPVERARARRVRTQTAAAGFGALAPDEEDALVEATITQTILPRLTALGVVPC